MKLFKFTAAVALLAGSLLLTAPPTATALPRQSFECWYYSDDSYSVEVGMTTLACGGYRSRWGVTSAYEICYYESCDWY